MALAKIKNITPVYPGYDNYPCDEDGKYILPRTEYEINGKTRSVIVIYRKNTVDFGEGLIGLCDGSNISNSDWRDLRDMFILEEDDGSQKLIEGIIGGSDSGAVAGVSPYTNIRMLYDKKTGQNNQPISNEQAYIFEYGHRNEELIAQGFASSTKLNVVKNNSVFFREDIGCVMANVDYLVQHLDGSYSILEIKTTNAKNKKVINDYHNGNVPGHYYCQAAIHYPMVMGSAFNIIGTYFAIGINNCLSDNIYLHFNRNEDVEKDLLEAEVEFNSYIKFNQPPALNIGSVPGKRVAEYIAQQFIQKNKEVDNTPFEMDAESVSAVEDYLAIERNIKELKREQDSLLEKQNMLKAKILDKLDGHSIAHITVNDLPYAISAKCSTRTSADTTVLKEKYPEAYADVIKQSTSVRFSIKERKGVSN